MEEYLPFLIIGVVVVVVVLGIIWSYYAEKKRTEALQKTADELGLPFFPTGDPILLGKLSQFNLFSQGRARKIKNMIHGDTEEVGLGIFDYQYTTGHGKHSKTWRQTVVYFESPNLQLPQFAMRPEHLFHKIGSLLGFQDINFDTHPQFSKTYHLQGADEAGVRQVFHPDVLEYLEGTTGISVEGQGNQLVFYRASVRIQPEKLRDLMSEGFEVFSLLKQSD